MPLIDRLAAFSSLKLGAYPAARLLRVVVLCAVVTVASALIAGCDLTTTPRDTATEDAVFTSEDGLQLYANSFYDWLPGAEDIYRGDNLSDYIAVNNIPPYLRPGFYSPSEEGGWDWDALRNFNYLLENNTNQNIDEATRQHFNGVARFFRAYFYFQKVKRYGEVPWVNRPLAIDDDELFQSQDSRDEVMTNVLEDINFAVDNIRTAQDPSRTRVSRDAALALKARIALFEGTFRKYQSDLGLGGHEEWLREAVSAAERLMESGNYSLYTAGENPYRTLFTTDAPNAQEDILALVFGREQGVLHNANWRFTSSTFGSRVSFVRQFINTYLNKDGTRFTDEAGYETMTFFEEMQGRDERLRQTIRHPGYERVSGGAPSEAPPNFDVTRTGYQPIKWTLDNADLDDGSNNTNSIALFRYAEVLLNYAEAKAELGTLTASDWDQTI
ncbi:MAG: RagB/SusD family nutrient uptake outer membrane protein, partial [Spirochaetes bacterium]|nr:RagB/SusD family nutrient uptake outer membrane protein [Spirochaetota bacterium]